MELKLKRVGVSLYLGSFLSRFLMALEQLLYRARTFWPGLESEELTIMVFLTAVIQHFNVHFVP